jgi:hypothetical protein
VHYTALEVDQPKRKAGRPKGSKNKSTLAAAALAQHGVTPLETHLDHQRYWKNIADAERAKPPGETHHDEVDPGGAAAHSAIEDGLKPLLESLHRALSAPLVIHRDQNGRAIGAGRAMN